MNKSISRGGRSVAPSLASQHVFLKQSLLHGFGIGASLIDTVKTRIHPEDPNVLASHTAASAQTFQNLAQDAQAEAQKYVVQGTQIWGQVSQAAQNVAKNGVTATDAASGLGSLLAVGTLALPTHEDDVDDDRDSSVRPGRGARRRTGGEP